MASMSRGFKYDIIKLIQSVRDKPCLWDKTLENYKDRVERRNAWEEIFASLDDGYEDMSWEDKKTTGELILNKWTNVRDTFVKTLKMKTGKPKKRYLYYDHLKFLTKVVPEDECSFEFNSEETVSYMKQESTCDGEGTSYSSSKKKKIDYNDDYVPKKSKRDRDDRKNQIESHDSYFESYEGGHDNIDFVEVESDPRLMNEDEAFFASLLPTIVKYSEDERLEFRIDVLAVMKRIKDKRAWHGDN